MDTPQTELTPQQARAQLAGTRGRSLASQRDRWLHAAGPMLAGVLIAVPMATRTWISLGVYLMLVLTAFCVLVAAVVCLGRASRTVPRHAGIWSSTGAIASVLVGMWAVMPWLAQAAETGQVSWPMALAGAAAIAAPGLICGVVIAAGRK